MLRLPEEPEITPPSFVLSVKHPCGTKVHANTLHLLRPAKGTKKPMNTKNIEGVFLSSDLFTSNIASQAP